MKKFSEYLGENVRNYFYTVKLSFKPSPEVMTKIEQALAKYNLVSITAPRSLPIQRADKDFPGINSPETYTFDVEVAYPAPAEFVRHTIAGLGLAMETVSVFNTEHLKSMEDEDNAVAARTGTGALLTKGLDPEDNAAISAEVYGDDYNSKLIKNSIGSTEQIIPKELKGKISGHTTDNRSGETLNDPKFAIGNKSAVGSTKQKTPVIKSFAR